jgi:hydroxyethylthiazole kinase-like uncharacterized protein yjeF
VLQGLAQEALARRAGCAIARLARALAPYARTVWIACGPGDNGVNGLEAAVALAGSGTRLTGSAQILASHPGPAGRDSPEAQSSLDRARAAGVRFVDAPPAMGDQDLCIDALLGLDAALAPVDEWIALALERLDRCGTAMRLAVDLPAGLDADTGVLATFARARGSQTQQRHTISLLAHKPGLFTADGRDAAGALWLDDLGAVAAAALPRAPDAWLAGAPQRRTRPHATHKGTHGDVLVFGGEHIVHRGLGMTGAAMLAGIAALHAGAGRVLVCLLGPEDAAVAFDAAQPELMLRTPAAIESADLSRVTVVCGCGGGSVVAPHLPRLLNEAPRLVLDADALNAAASDRALRQSLERRAQRADRHTVLTPHPLEAARLLDSDTKSVQSDRLSAARAMADRYRCTVVLKGSGTVTCAPGQVPMINPTGNGRLASAGTGDVLAGLAGARLASGLPAFEAATAAVFEHGSVADEWPADRPLTASALARGLCPL